MVVRDRQEEEQRERSIPVGCGQRPTGVGVSRNHARSKADRCQTVANELALTRQKKCSFHPLTPLTRFP